MSAGRGPGRRGDHVFADRRRPAGACVPSRPPSGTCRRGRTSRQVLPQRLVGGPTRSRRAARPASGSARTHSGALARSEGSSAASRPRAGPRARPEPGTRRRRDHGRGHEVRPQREAGRDAPGHQRRAGRLAAASARAGAHAPAAARPQSRSAAGYMRRRQRRQQQEVGRRAGHQHGRGQRRPRVERASQAVGQRDRGQAQQEVEQAQRAPCVGPRAATNGAASQASSGEP